MMKKINTSINDLKSVLDTIQSGVISINKDKFLIFYNDKAKRIFSLSILAKCFSKMDLDNVYIKPVLRDLIDNIESDNEYVA